MSPTSDRSAINPDTTDTHQYNTAEGVPRYINNYNLFNLVYENIFLDTLSSGVYTGDSCYFQTHFDLNFKHQLKVTFQFINIAQISLNYKMLEIGAYFIL